MTSQKRLYRSRSNRVFTGLAAGLGEYLGIDPNLVRVVLALLILGDPRFLALYILLAIVAPEGDHEDAAFEEYEQPKRKHASDPF
jgi:phage shock protein C